MILKISSTFQSSPKISQNLTQQMLLYSMPKREKSSTKKPQNMGCLQKIPLKKSYKTIFDFYIQHRNIVKSPNVLKNYSTLFIKSCRNRDIDVTDFSSDFGIKREKRERISCHEILKYTWLIR